MVDENTDFFEIIDHFKEISDIPSNPVFENRLKDKPRFTIAIPTYKRAKYLKETIESALNQDTEEEYEIVVADNNPERDDETEKMMAAYALLPNVSYYKHSRNIGMAGNWNRLVELSRGKYFVLLHDDDCIAPFYLRAASIILEKIPDASLLQFSKINNKNFVMNEKDMTVRRVRLFENIRFNTLGAPSGGIYLIPTVKELGGWDKSYYPSLDYCFDSKLMLTHKAYQSSIKSVYYRIAIGESLRREVQIGFINIDRNLQNKILEKFRIPKIIRAIYVEDRVEQTLKYYNLSVDDIFPIKINHYTSLLKLIITKSLHLYIRIISLSACAI